jgi:hypothetical protein
MTDLTVIVALFNDLSFSDCQSIDLFNSEHFSMSTIIVLLRVQMSHVTVYLTFLMALTSLGVLLTVWIQNLYHRDDALPPSSAMRKAAFRLQWLMCKIRRREKVGVVK